MFLSFRAKTWQTRTVKISKMTLVKLRTFILLTGQNVSYVTK
uniref:Uncharacterized protein n=1 Tax=Anguilla anguilla TaxID=7936 RepID=A0A0E9SGQ9_ANGAN